MHITPKEYLFGFVPEVLQALIAVVMIRRGLFRQFPIFTIYTIYQVLTIPIIYAELALQVSTLHYAYTWYPLQVCSIGFGFLVIYEVFRIVLQPYDAFTRIWRLLFFLSAFVLLAVAVIWITQGTGSQADRLTQSMNLLQRSLRFVQVGLLLLLFVLSGSLGLSWRSCSFGVALGYGTFAIVDLVLLAVRLQYGNGFWKMQSALGTVAYNMMVLIWVWYFLQDKQVFHPVRVIPHNDIEKWNAKLEELLRPKRVQKSDAEEEENDDLPVSRR